MSAPGAMGQGRGSIYYGWWVLAAGAAIEMLSIGSTSYGAALFVLPLEKELSLSRAAASAAIPVLFSGAAIMATIVGLLLDRFAIERVIAIGALALAGGFAAVSYTSSIPIMALALFVPAAFGFMATGPLTTATLVSRWFYRRRGRALGIATVATSGGGLLALPLNWAIQTYGWRMALRMEAFLIVLIVVTLAAFVVRSGPADLKLQAHPENAGRPASDMPRHPGAAAIPQAWRLSTILMTVNFWSVAVALAAISGIAQALVVSIVPYGVGLGFAPESAALLITLFSISAALVKVGSGVLAEFVDLRWIMLASAVAMALSLTLLLSSSTYPALVLACCLAGTALGCILPSTAAFIAANFGSSSFGTAMGPIYVAIGVSSIVSVWFAGAVFDRTGTYHDAFVTFVGLALAAACATAMSRRAPSYAAVAPAAGSENIVDSGSPR